MALATVIQAKSPSMEIMEITPDLAKHWLLQNTHNRVIRQIVVDRYAGAMSRGEWMMNGEAIKWSSDSAILDGQHRLLAVIASGVTIESLVVFGLPSEVQDTLDHHAIRALRDVLTLHGEHSANDLAACLVTMFRFDVDRMNYTVSPTAQQALSLLERYPSIRASIPLGQRVNDAIGLPRGMTGGSHCFLAQIDADDADFFFARLVDGQELLDGSPILAFREWCLREFRIARSIGGRRPDRQRTLAYLIKAWNAWRDGTEMRQMRWAVGGAHPESFPKPR